MACFPLFRKKKKKSETWTQTDESAEDRAAIADLVARLSSTGREVEKLRDAYRSKHTECRDFKRALGSAEKKEKELEQICLKLKEEASKNEETFSEGLEQMKKTLEETLSQEKERSKELNGKYEKCLQELEAQKEKLVNAVQDLQELDERRLTEIEELKTGHDMIIDGLENEIEMLEIRRKREICTRIKEECGDIKVAHKMLNTRYDELLKGQEDLVAENERLKSEAERSRSTLKETENKYQMSDANYKKLIEDHNASLLERNRSVSEAEKLAKRFSESNLKKDDEIMKLKKRLAELEQTKGGAEDYNNNNDDSSLLSKRCLDLETENKVMSAGLRKLQLKYDALKRENTRLASPMIADRDVTTPVQTVVPIDVYEALRSECNRANDRCRALEKEREKMSKAMAKMSAELKDVQAKFAASETVNKDLKQELNELSKQLRGAEAGDKFSGSNYCELYFALKAEFSGIQADRNRLRNEIAQFRNQKSLELSTDERRDLARLRLDNDELTNKVNSLKEKLKSLKQLNKKLSEENFELKEDRKDDVMVRKVLEAQARDRKEEFDQLSAELATVNMKNNELHRKLDDSYELLLDKDKLEELYELTHDQLDKTKSNLETLNKVRKELVASNAESVSKCRDMKDDLVRLARENGTLKEELSKYEDQLYEMNLQLMKGGRR